MKLDFIHEIGEVAMPDHWIRKCGTSFSVHFILGGVNHRRYFITEKDADLVASAFPLGPWFYFVVLYCN